MEFEVKLPILGFEDVKKMRLEKIDDLFMRLENVDDELPSFTMINPFALREYEFDAPAASKALLELEKDSSNILVLNIMIVNSPIEESTVNFLAPVIFNFEKQYLGQIILDSSRYPQYGITERISSYMGNNNQSEESSAPQQTNSESNIDS